MPKIDISTIEGYETMTAEEKVAALEAYTMPDPDYTGYVTKKMFDETASELAKKKKELRERMSAEEAAKQQEAENLQQMQEELAQLRKTTKVAEHKSKLLALGYDDALAGDTALALVEGDTEKVFANQAVFLQAQKQAVITEQMRRTPLPVGGSSSGEIDYQAKINEAMGNKDGIAIAYYTRLAAEQEATKK